MSPRIISRSLFILAIALIGFGCKTATSTDPVVPPVTHDPGSFGYIYNGTSIDRKDFPGVSSLGSIAYSPNYKAPGYTLDVTLMVQQTPGKETKVELVVPMTAPGTGKWDVAASGVAGKASVTLTLDTLYFSSVAGGTVEISEFDPITNLVSGTFSFDGVHNGVTEHVTTGYFSKIPISYGTLNQGLVTADISIGGISDSFTSAGTDPSPSLYTVDSGQTFVIIAHCDDGTTQREIDFGISNIQVGYANLDHNSGYRWFGQYNSFGGLKASIITAGGAVGKITITKFDWVTHRMNATFYMSGYDQKTGSYIDVSNGQINNVLWFAV